MTQASNVGILTPKINSSGQLDATTGLTGAVPVANGGTGAATYTANNVLLGNGTSAFQTVAPGANGNVLTSNGTTWTSAAASGGSSSMRYQLFTTVGSNTFTIPTGVTAIKVTVQGGGGGGGSARNGAFSGGGGSGATSIQYLSGLTPGNTLTITVGAGGTAGSGGGNGGTGGTSSVASGTQTITTVSSTGGAGGATANNSAGGAGGAGGSGSNTLISLSSDGQTGIYTSVCCTSYVQLAAGAPVSSVYGLSVTANYTTSTSGAGGGATSTSYYGNVNVGPNVRTVVRSGGGGGMNGGTGISGLNIPSNNVTGTSATTYGSGGGGASSGNLSYFNGGAGAQGYVYVEYI